MNLRKITYPNTLTRPLKPNGNRRVESNKGYTKLTTTYYINSATVTNQKNAGFTKIAAKTTMMTSPMLPPS